jgi:3-oxoacyl-[acyl-carrier protein] reductase
VETEPVNFDLSGRRVVVCGGSRGIGRWIALGFAASGAAVSTCARGMPALEEVRAASGGKVHIASCDLAQEAEITRYIGQAAEALGGIDVLVNNATGYGLGDSEEDWAASLDVDLLAAVRASRAAMPHLMAAGGQVDGFGASIVNISSGSGLNPSVRTPAYGAAKAAVIHYTRTQAAALAKHGIRVNCVAPGSIEFPAGLWDRSKEENPALYAQILNSMPAGRLGRPEEVANVVIFLASPMANWVTAQVIGVSGGQGFGR